MMPMINDTEQRKTSEQAPREAFEAWYSKDSAIKIDFSRQYDGSNHYLNEDIDWAWWVWQAALAQSEQEAPSLCTAEEAAELAEQLSIQRFRNFGEDGMTFTASPEQLAAIINADRAKR
jgi:hypothetical protein